MLKALPKRSSKNAIIGRMRQDQALYLMGQGRSVFLTGPAGTGKTYVLNQLIRTLKKKKKQVAITASTGIAATHLNGTTIHSWSGLGIRDELTSRDKVWLSNNTKLNKRYNATDVLIIDEVSMLHGRRLDMINEVCKLLRQNDEPFGGLQLVLTGDFFQLPPVNREGGDDDFVYRSQAWQELNPAICYLKDNYRQESGALLEVLQAMRAQDLRRRHLDHLQSQLHKEPPAELVLTRLFAHNIDVEKINVQELAKLSGRSRFYEMETKGRKAHIEALQKSVMAPEMLELKLDAEVMFVANNFPLGFANGSRGRVVDFDEETDVPIVQLQRNNRKILVEPHSWSREEDGRERGSVTQLPLRLAWAITIHKSQGMSLDSALIDLSQTFTYGMGYVALSRVRTLDGLYLSGLNAMALKLHPDIYALDMSLRAASEALAEEIGDAVIQAAHDEAEAIVESVQANPELLNKLKAWRARRAKSDAMPAYIIAHDKTLEQVAERVPQTKQQLLAVNGFGPKKLEQYGQEILEITVIQH